MRFLLDHDVYAITARYLSELGHDVVTVARIGYAQADDSDLPRNKTASWSQETETSADWFLSSVKGLGDVLRE